MIYLQVDPEYIDELKALISNDENVDNYLKAYGDDWEAEGFDITAVWMEVADRFNKEIWLSKKGNKFRFYEYKWYHNVYQYLKRKCRWVKSRYRSYRTQVDIKIYNFKEDRRQKNHMKKTMKSYR